jgi:hypothetical protein
MSQVTGRPLVKGYLGKISNGEMVDLFGFQYNPTEVTRARTVEYIFTSPPGSPLPFALFKNISGDTFTLQLLLDAVEEYDQDSEGTSAMKAALETYTQPDYDEFSDDLGQFVAPPMAIYSMGEESFEVVVLSVQFRDIRWNRDGISTRTYADLQMRTAFTNIASLRARLDRLNLLRQRTVTSLSARR